MSWKRLGSKTKLFEGIDAEFNAWKFYQKMKKKVGFTIHRIDKPKRDASGMGKTWEVAYYFPYID